MAARMNDLLQWSTTNSVEPTDPTYVPPRQMKDVDPGLIEMILGKPDAVRMKDAMAIATDEQKSAEDRVQALDDLELLVESLDNANDLQSIKLWPPLMKLASLPDQDIATQALWVMGTAIQNNPQSQGAFLSNGGLEVTFTVLSSTKSSDAARAKAMYCLSGALKHCQKGVAVMNEEGGKGWKALKGAVQDPSIIIRRKAAFLIRALLTPSGDDSTETSSEDMDTTVATRCALSEYGIIPTLVSGVTTATAETGDIDFEENAMHALVLFLRGGGQTEQLDLIELVKLKGSERGDDWNLGSGDWETVERHDMAGQFR